MFYWHTIRSLIVCNLVWKLSKLLAIGQNSSNILTFILKFFFFFNIRIYQIKFFRNYTWNGDIVRISFIQQIKANSFFMTKAYSIVLIIINNVFTKRNFLRYVLFLKYAIGIISNSYFFNIYLIPIKKNPHIFLFTF